MYNIQTQLQCFKHANIEVNTTNQKKALNVDLHVQADISSCVEIDVITKLLLQTVPLYDWTDAARTPVTHKKTNSTYSS